MGLRQLAAPRTRRGRFCDYPRIMMIGLAVALVLSQSSPKVQIIKGGGKKAQKTTETSLVAPQSGPTAEQQAREAELSAKTAELNAKSDELNARADALKAREDKQAERAEKEAKLRAQQQKIIEKHAQDMQKEYENAANALAGQE